jgi:branched-chain amino acid transport system ATP-binding protein
MEAEKQINTMPMLSVSGLSIAFGGLRALDDVSFDVTPGEVFSIIGPNGSGKTTALNCIGGEYRPDTGGVRFMGQDITGLPPHRIARMGISRTFQNLELFPTMTTLENILVGRHIHQQHAPGGDVLRSLLSFVRPGAKDETAQYRAADEIIQWMGLSAVRNVETAELSYGQKKLVELARAVVMEPRLLLLDEPSGGMSAVEKARFVTRIGDLKKRAGMTIVLVEHDMNLVMEVSDEIVVLNFGRVIARGTPREVQTHPDVLAAYLGEDYTHG